VREPYNIRSFFRQDGLLQNLAALGECIGGFEKVLVVGGALRELTLAELCCVKPEIPDIDVAVLIDFDPQDVIHRLGSPECELNSFGGIKWRAKGSLPLDIWSVRAWAERIGKSSRSKYELEEVKGFLDFNLNAGVYAPYRDELDVLDIRNAVVHRIFELHNSLVPPDSVQLARVVKLERRVENLGFCFGPELRRYVMSVIGNLDSAGFIEAKKYFERKAGPNFDGTPGKYFEQRIARLESEEMPFVRRPRTRA